MIQPSIVKNPPYPRNYASEFLLLDRGEGIYLFDEDGNRYRDFAAGIAVNALGYGREDLAKIAHDQMLKLIHVSNLYANKPALELAEKLVGSGDFAAVHFGNSGSEANEAALKYARIYGKRKKGPDCYHYLSFTGSFHGRTMGALAATSTAKYRESYEPLAPGFHFAEYNNVSRLEEVLDDKFCAVIVEPLQGEGGCTPMNRDFAEALNRICREKDILIIADEVQAGMARCGEIFSSSLSGLKPDIVTLSKPLAAGLPLSATLIPEKVNDYVHLGDHGGTFGGGPVTTAIASYMWDILTEKSFLEEIRRKGFFLEEQLMRTASEIGLKAHVTGAGLLRGLVLENEEEAGKIGDIITDARSRGLIILRAGSNVVRLAPPLVITEEEIAEGLGILKESMKEVLSA
ncbi:MAG: aminotransferase class III-fold pyridoxal phosphate-dependent enzyme [Spirochaetales bacterium]|nr:aminotransferase class III-fold pyridoxal phosphate-dependent enzyme [Spirochaetales bacterium]